MTKHILALALLLLSAHYSATATAAQDSLEGIWVSHTPFVRPSGTVTVQKTAKAWTVTIGAKTQEFQSNAKDVSFDIRADNISFKGHLEKSGNIEGFWIQEGVTDQPFAAPLTLLSTTKDAWTATIPDLKLGFTLYLKIFKREDGVLIGAFRNPEVNTRGGASRFYVESSENEVRFLERNDGQPGIIHKAALQRDPQRLRLMWPQFRRELELSKQTPEQAAAFFPRLPGTQYSYQRPEATNDGWQTASASDEGVDQTKLTALVQTIAGSDPAERQPNLIHSLLVARNGKLILDEYFFGHDRDTMHDLRSAGKTFASVLLGAAALENQQLSPNTKLLHLLQPNPKPANPSPLKDKITLAHLMTHTSGLACNDNDEKSPGNEEKLQSQQDVLDWWKYTLDLPALHEPGTRYAYCSAGMNLMGAALKKATATWLPELLLQKIARPLQFQSFAWNLAPNGEGYLGGGARLRPRDLLKIGQLYLNGGEWNGQRVLSKDWTVSSTTPVIQINETTTGLVPDDFKNAYVGGADALAWHSFEITVDDKSYQEYEAAGNGGQLLIVVPELKLAVVMTGGNYGQGGIWTRWRDLAVGQAIIPAIATR